MKQITGVEDGSISDKLGIKKGDYLLTINNENVKDVFDYRFLIADEKLTIEIQKENGEKCCFKIKKRYSEDLGIIFSSGLMDNALSCRNKCIFCFIDQLPKNMRETLYFKDDDSRLSFLQGNYVTLTNMSDDDLNRIIKYHLSPINISVHTTNPEIRKSMLKNPNAINVIECIKRLAEAGITLNFQIVLCKGINDNKELDRTIEDLATFMPKAQSLSVVPVGLTKHRDKLFPLLPFEKEDAEAVLEQIHKHQHKFIEEWGTAFVYGADEFYLKAGWKLPKYKEYEDFPQLENGVGMIRLMQNEFDRQLAKLEEITINPVIVTLVTGASAYKFICGLSKKIMNKVNGLTMQVILIKNNFFGEQITVSGLLTATDIMGQLEKINNLGKVVFVPENALRADSNIFLDDYTTKDIEKRLKVKVKSSPSDGKLFLQGIIAEVVNEKSNSSYSR